MNNTSIDCTKLSYIVPLLCFDVQRDQCLNVSKLFQYLRCRVVLGKPLQVLSTALEDLLL